MVSLFCDKEPVAMLPSKMMWIIGKGIWIVVWDFWAVIHNYRVHQTPRCSRGAAKQGHPPWMVPKSPYSKHPTNTRWPSIRDGRYGLKVISMTRSGLRRGPHGLKEDVPMYKLLVRPPHRYWSPADSDRLASLRLVAWHLSTMSVFSWKVHLEHSLWADRTSIKSIQLDFCLFNLQKS